MKCPFCKKEQLVVLNSRPTKHNTQIWRRRKCLNCGESVTTYEVLDLSYLRVSKSDGTMQRYNRAKLFSGIFRASLQKKNVDRYGRGALVEKITSEVEEQILSLKLKVVSTEQIRDIVLKTLRKHDTSLFLSFLAYFSKVSSVSLKKKIMEYM